MGTGLISARGSLGHVARYAPGKPIEEVQRELGLTHVVKLASNENAYGCSPKAAKAVAEEMAKAALYPESVSPRLAEKLVFVCNPNNPTGTIVGADALRRFIECVPARVLVVVDEAYYEYVTSADYLQTIPLLGAHPNLVVLRTFSKIYGLAGLRIGYGAMHPDVASVLHKVRGPFNTSRLAQAAALASLDDADFAAMCREQNAQERDRVARSLAEMGLRVYLSETHFLLFEVPGSGEEVAHRLLRHGVIVRAGEGLGAPGTVRVSLGTPEENDAFLRALTHSME
ncbi:pyridoxal phosphate-dependent aminotransferase [Alicyclobacillus sendaiensis]|uniref:pyridoxal phosphate-dependent aminotransferase n=1 Tax=Alicyclobacillus sendaiensis TaxID=192387 RepID=UPI000AFC79E3|nr:aminotransferase class I/II-fold pyridoxal phosphate-dependent enzyme [Alicyclobacillus sendaiensis]